MRSLTELINSCQPLTRKEVAEVERYLWSSSVVVSLGRDYEHLKGAARADKVKWFSTWSNK